jgi:hypothetical protein
MEHLGNPRIFMNKAHSLLQKGGYFILTTLSADGFDIQLLWDKSKSIFPPCHINFFNPASIAELARDTGFKVDSISTPGKLDWDIVENRYRKDKVDIGRFWQTVCEKAPLNAKKKLQDWLSRNGFSSHMLVVLRKE